ncbi:hypothetical protein FraQA3DRAFT_3076 [Frankia sp. QA3]|nr:hypothetical protein FraQA3DRAFT_3076 [Frankia sp. QA3]
MEDGIACGNCEIGQAMPLSKKGLTAGQFDRANQFAYIRRRDLTLRVMLGLPDHPYFQLLIHAGQLIDSS